MKKLFFIVSIVITGCCSTGKTVNGNKDDAKGGKTETVVKNSDYQSDKSLPVCLKSLIDKFKVEEKQNPPRSVYRYTYNSKTVYFVPAICCDFFSDLYDDQCTIIAHPDGGFTGKGDGRAADFVTARTGEQLIWKDNR